MSYTCLLASTTSWGGISSVPISRTKVLSLSCTWNQRKARNLRKLVDNHTIINNKTCTQAKHPYDLTLIKYISLFWITRK